MPLHNPYTLTLTNQKASMENEKQYFLVSHQFLDLLKIKSRRIYIYVYVFKYIYVFSSPFIFPIPSFTSTPPSHNHHTIVHVNEQYVLIVLLLVLIQVFSVSIIYLPTSVRNKSLQLSFKHSVPSSLTQQIYTSCLFILQTQLCVIWVR